MTLSVIDTTTFQKPLTKILHLTTIARNLTLGVTLPLTTAWFQSDLISNLYNCILHFLVPNGSLAHRGGSRGRVQGV